MVYRMLLYTVYFNYYYGAVNRNFDKMKNHMLLQSYFTLLTCVLQIARIIVLWEKCSHH